MKLWRTMHSRTWSVPGELSGYKAEIDPEQDVASTSRIDIVIKNVASPVIRHINIKIGFSKTV